MLGAVKSQWFNNLPRSGKTSGDTDEGDELDIRLLHKQHFRKRLSIVLSLAAFVLFIILSLFNVAAIIRRLTTASRYESPEVEFVELS
jgi:hypothetical protein